MAMTGETNMKGAARCGVCWRHCLIPEGGLGYCRARTTNNGVVLAENYGKLTSLALDPIEKKPLSRFYPGSYILSAGSYGCNMSCPFCQNFEIAHDARGKRRSANVSPEELVERALFLRYRGNVGIAFTYNEPLVGYEFVRDTAVLARLEGLETVVVTNGQIAAEPLDELLPLITAWNIDLKSFNNDAYKKLGGRLDVTLRTIERAAETAHVEVTTLVVPGLSDNEEEMEREAAYLASVNRDIVLHLSRYFPCWQYDVPATPRETLYRLCDIAKKYLPYVVLGNI